MTSPPLIPILANEICIGHLLDRGRAGWEAFDCDDQSIGVFATPSAAIDALIVAASTPPEAA